MFDAGVIKQVDGGGFEAVMDPNEQESIRSQQAEQSKRRPIVEADIDRINADLDRMEQIDDEGWAAFGELWFLISFLWFTLLRQLHQFDWIF